LANTFFPDILVTGIMAAGSKKKRFVPPPVTEASFLHVDEAAFEYDVYREQCAKLAVGEDESREDFERLFDLTVKELKPADAVERTLVQHIVWAFWRLEQVKLAEVRVIQLAVHELKAATKTTAGHLQAMALELLSRSDNKPLERLAKCQQLAYENCQRSMKLLGSYRSMRATEPSRLTEKQKNELLRAQPLSNKIQ
jgi:hypothetical protein